ncbi:hypothetical protein WN51_13902 [Melipona quadrifasciata]|uniref:Uncharacterized protein n=1 Tax=Melipona quadrifasciata TaxID=166423 RepID=A0A0N0U5B2_9HYME|nr:hypothetical protein WN51_13902 [Melipona quadrifasciata]
MHGNTLALFRGVWSLLAPSCSQGQLLWVTDENPRKHGLKHPKTLKHYRVNNSDADQVSRNPEGGRQIDPNYARRNKQNGEGRGSPYRGRPRVSGPERENYLTINERTQSSDNERQRYALEFEREAQTESPLPKKCERACAARESERPEGEEAGQRGRENFLDGTCQRAYPGKTSIHSFGLCGFTRLPTLRPARESSVNCGIELRNLIRLRPTVTTPPSFNRIGYGHSDRVKRTVRPYERSRRSSGLLQRAANDAEGLPGITTSKLHRPGKESKSLAEGICRKKQGRRKERMAVLVHVNKRQAAYEKKTGITLAIMGK